MSIDLELPTSLGATGRLSQYKGTLVFLLCEATDNAQANEWFKSELSRVIQRTPALQAKARLVVIADLAGLPSVAKTIVPGIAQRKAVEYGLTELWLDWDGATRRAFGLPTHPKTPIYALIGRDGKVVWGKFGVLPPDAISTLSQKIEPLIAE